MFVLILIKSQSNGFWVMRFSLDLILFMVFFRLSVSDPNKSAMDIRAGGSTFAVDVYKVHLSMSDPVDLSWNPDGAIW